VNDRVVVGRVGRPHGLDGSFFVEDASEDPQRFAVGATLRAGAKTVVVVESKRSGGRPVIRVDAAVPRGTPLEVERSALPETGPDEYYVFELVGLAVEREDGTALGAVVDVEPGLANDVLALDTGVRLPLVEACVRQVDLAGGRILVRPGFDHSD
jgi:16S rRNA processing protein RimM